VLQRSKLLVSGASRSLAAGGRSVPVDKTINPSTCERQTPELPLADNSKGPGANLLRDPTLARIGAAHSCSAAAVALAWAIRSGNVIAIPESGSAAHVKENAVALSLTLTPEDLQTLDAAHPPPRH
jgi:aryl-alcohol dehydrogenase-like predicted oxidoreductase